MWYPTSGIKDFEPIRGRNSTTKYIWNSTVLCTISHAIDTMFFYVDSFINQIEWKIVYSHYFGCLQSSFSKTNILNWPTRNSSQRNDSTLTKSHIDVHWPFGWVISSFTHFSIHKIKYCISLVHLKSKPPIFIFLSMMRRLQFILLHSTSDMQMLRPSLIIIIFARAIYTAVCSTQN